MMGGLREDHRLMKAIYRVRGLNVLMDWQLMPFVDTGCENNPVSIKQRSNDYIKGAFDHLLFDSAVYYFGAISHSKEKRPVAKTRQFSMISRMIVPGHEERDTVSIVNFAENMENGKIMSVGFHVDNLTGDISDSMYDWFTGKRIESIGRLVEYVQDSAIWAANDMRRLGQCDEHQIQVRSNYTQTNRQRKTAQSKPWIREDLPRIIMLDLAKANALGHRANLGGTHSAPIPHRRRGHWHTLSHKKWKRNRDGSVRRIWVRPAWVGDKEWVHKGSTYRVLDAEISSGGD